MDHLSRRARRSIEECDVLVGYKTYINLLGNLVNNKDVFCSGMTEEVKRSEYAIEKARKGRRVCIISSGDPGVYGMAGLILELLKKEDTDKLNIEIIPGVIAAAASASLLGAPLSHDFAVISLSDLLTDMDLIKQRIESAVKADFVIVLYNPKSAKRVIPFYEACGILLKYRPADTAVGIVRNAYRKDQRILITTLKKMPSVKNINMVTTIIIGNSKTYVKNKYMITPRGYNIKRQRGK